MYILNWRSHKHLLLHRFFSKINKFVSSELKQIVFNEYIFFEGYRQA